MQCLLSQRPHRHPVIQLQHEIQGDKEVMRSKPGLILVERRILPVPHLLAWNGVQLVDPLITWNPTDRPVSEDNQQWNQNRP